MTNITHNLINWGEFKNSLINWREFLKYKNINIILKEYLTYIFNDINIPFNDILYNIYEKLFWYYQFYEKKVQCEYAYCIDVFIVCGKIYPKSHDESNNDILVHCVNKECHELFCKTQGYNGFCKLECYNNK